MATKKSTTTNVDPTNTGASVRHEVVIAVPKLRVPKLLSPLQGFVDFVREQGVVGVAIGLVIGTQIKTLVDQFIASFVNPLLGLMLPGKGDLATKTFSLTLNGKTNIFSWGAFVAQLLSFLATAAIVYFAVKALKLDRLDKKKDK
jgi:large conductance mechanosensitive channel